MADHCRRCLDSADAVRWRCQFAIYSEQGVFEIFGVRKIAVSHAKVQLIQWIDRDLDWLERAKEAA